MLFTGMIIVGLIFELLIGALVGWIAGQIMESEGGFLRNMVLGVLGGIVGGSLFRIIGFSAHGIVANVIVSVIGACICIWLGRKIL